MTAQGPRSGQGGTSRAAPELEGAGGPGGPGPGHPRGDSEDGGAPILAASVGRGQRGARGARPAVGPGVSRRSSPGLCWVRTSRGPDALCLGWRLRLRHRLGAGGEHGGPAAPGWGWGRGAPRWAWGARGPWCRAGGSGGCGGRRGWGGRGTWTGLGVWGGGHGTRMGQGGRGTPVRGIQAPRRSCPRPGSLPAGAEHYGVGTGARDARDCPQRVTPPSPRGTVLPSREDRRGPGPVAPLVLRAGGVARVSRRRVPAPAVPGRWPRVPHLGPVFTPGPGGPAQSQ